MPDVVDRAQHEETALREAALAARRGGESGDQVRLAGRVVCRDCGEPIASARLRILPTACRCVPCQEEADRQGVRP